MSTHNALVVENADLISRLTAAKAEADAMRAERDEQKADAHKWFGIALDNKHRYEAAEAREQALLSSYDTERKVLVENVALRAEVARLTADLDWLKRSIFGSANYHPCLLTGNFAEMAQTTEAARVGALARAEAAEAEVARLADLVKGYEHWADDVKRLTRTLDVELHGDGAAQQASLCDIIGAIKEHKDREQQSRDALTAELDALRAAQDALVAAAYEAAAEVARKAIPVLHHEGPNSDEEEYIYATLGGVKQDIRALTPADAVAALAAYARAERNRARREAAAVAKEIADQFVGYMGRIERAINAMIEKE